MSIQKLDKISRKGRTVSLVLGSGGARGLVHIGIIEQLQEYGFDIRSISGSSMGALIGGVYAAGKLDRYTQWITALAKIDVIRLMDFSFHRNGLFKGERIIRVLKELIGEYNIEDLPISFTAVATDLQEQKEVWLNRGPLFDAIHASIAIPAIFAPYQYGNKQLIDGSIVNPIPIAPTLNDNTDITVVVDLNGKPETEFDKINRVEDESEGVVGAYRQRVIQFIEDLQATWGEEGPKEMGVFDIIAATMETMQAKLSRFQLAAYWPDVIITIPRNVCTFFEFHRAKELIHIGEQRAKIALSQL